MTAPTQPHVDEDASEFTLAELERVVDVSARTIRYYQSEGLLPRPTRRGGQAVYGQQHLQRLRSIAALQAQGLRLQTIRSVLGEGEPAVEVVDLLGPEVAGTAWLATSARTLDEGELADLLGDAYPDDVPDIVAAGFLERRTGPDGRGVWFAPSVPQLRGALEMRALGTDFALSGWSAEAMRVSLRDLCERHVAKWLSEAGRHFHAEQSQASLEAHLETIRAVAWQAAAHVMAEEITAAVHRGDELLARVESGELDPDAA